MDIVEPFFKFILQLRETYQSLMFYRIYHPDEDLPDQSKDFIDLLSEYLIYCDEVKDSASGYVYVKTVTMF
jgi:hypothetical protein